MNRRNLLTSLLPAWLLTKAGWSQSAPTPKLAPHHKLPVKWEITPGSWELLGRWRLAKMEPEGRRLFLDRETFERWSDTFVSSLQEREVVGRYAVFTCVVSADDYRWLYFERIHPYKRRAYERFKRMHTPGDPLFEERFGES